MPHFLQKISAGRSLCVGVAGLCWMLAAPVSSTQAQSSNPNVGVPAPANRNAKIDAKARAILDTMIATYMKTNAYSGKFDIQRTGVPDSPNSTGEVAWQKPNKFKIVGTVKGVTNTYVYDGSRFSYSSSRYPGEYVQVTPKPERDVLTEATTETALEGTALLLLLAGRDPMRQIEPYVQTLSLVDENSVGGAGKDMDVVVANFSRTWSTGTLTYIIGKRDHLLRRVTLSQTTRGKTATVVEIHTDVQANDSLPTSAFRFVPAPAATRVEEPEPIEEPTEESMMNQP